MDVITKQPTNSEQTQDLPPAHDEQPSAQLLPAGYDGVYGQPVALQRSSQLWMPIPTNIPLTCPPGLEYLTAINEMLVDQQIELIEAFLDCANRYQIVNGLNQLVYFATEESDCCERYCFKNARSFKMHIWDNYGREVMRVIRPFQCMAGCCWCANTAACSLYIDVEAPVGQLVGRVRQTQSCWKPHYDIMSPYDDVLLKIRGPTCACDGPCFTKDQDFVIYTPDLEDEIGKISKKWSGLVREMFTHSDKFGISFPIDLDVKVKATLFGALFLIDFMFFERRQD